MPVARLWHSKQHASAATVTHGTMEELLEMVFSVGSSGTSQVMGQFPASKVMNMEAEESTLLWEPSAINNW
jgi:hypothetical protein